MIITEEEKDEILFKAAARGIWQPVKAIAYYQERLHTEGCNTRALNSYLNTLKKIVFSIEKYSDNEIVPLLDASIKTEYKEFCKARPYFMWLMTALYQKKYIYINKGYFELAKPPYFSIRKFLTAYKYIAGLKPCNWWIDKLFNFPKGKTGQNNKGLNPNTKPFKEFYNKLFS